jgi:hypothetical protein
MSWFKVLKRGGMSGGMSGYGKLQPLAVHTGQLLASKFHSIFDLKDKFEKKITTLLFSIFLRGKKLHCLILL